MPYQPIRPAAGTVRKAKKAAQVAVYDAAGNLVGTVDQVAITAVGSAAADSPNKTAAKRVAQNIANAPAHPAASDPGIEEITKALAGATVNPEFLTAVSKGVTGSGDQFAELLKSVDAGTALALRNGVAMVGLRIAAGQRVTGGRAVALAKQAAVAIAAHRARTQPRGDREVIAEITRRIAR